MEEKIISKKLEQFYAKIFSTHSQEEIIKIKDAYSNRELQMLDAFYLNSPVVALIFNYVTFSYDYFSPNMKSILGYEKKDFLEGGLKLLLSRIFQPHKTFFTQFILPAIIKHLSLYSKKGCAKDLKFSYTFKTKRRDDQYIWVNYQLSIMETNLAGFPVKSFLTIEDITDMKSNDVPEIIVSLKGKNSYYAPIYSHSLHVSEENFGFSKREHEILLKLSEGKTSKQIAFELKISPHTVISHRKKLLEKSKMKNTAELIKFTSDKGILTKTIAD